MATLSGSTLRQLVETAPDAIVAVDATGRIVLVNEQAERLFGYSREELVGETVDVLVPEDARRVHRGHRDHYLIEPRPRPMGAGVALAGRRKDGSEFPAEISLSAFESDDGPLVSAGVRDVTERIEAQAERHRLMAEAERERLEAQLHQSQRLESLGQLAGGVAHDFNNLLGVILSYSSLVSAELATAAEVDPARWTGPRRDVEEIQHAAERAARLTHQLLAFARREVVRPQLLDVNAVVSDLEHLLRRTLGEQVELSIALGERLHPVLADPGQIEQVLVNLAVNARDAMVGGGRLTIETQNVLVDRPMPGDGDIVLQGDCVCLRVTDTGVGMEPTVVARVFEPFFTTKGKGEGSGLGLATVYGVVAQAGGVGTIESEPGRGTTVTIWLPVSDAPVDADSPPPAGETRPAVETVLVVEDEDALREATRRLLVRNGFEVIIAANGPEAIELARAHGGPIDLLLTDVVMPQMSGVDVASRVRELRRGIRVLFMSGFAAPALGSRGRLEAGMTLLEKPFSEATLLEHVRSVLDQVTG